MSRRPGHSDRNRLSCQRPFLWNLRLTDVVVHLASRRRPVGRVEGRRVLSFPGNRAPGGLTSPGRHTEHEPNSERDSSDSRAQIEGVECSVGPGRYQVNLDCIMIENGRSSRVAVVGWRRGRLLGRPGVRSEVVNIDVLPLQLFEGLTCRMTMYRRVGRICTNHDHAVAVLVEMALGVIACPWPAQLGWLRIDRENLRSARGGEGCRVGSCQSAISAYGIIETKHRCTHIPMSSWRRS